jgi:hypothetical protein
MSEPDYTQAIYDHIRESGDPGDVVLTDIHPWLRAQYGLSASDAKRVRRDAMIELTSRGLIERLKVRSRYVAILG